MPATDAILARADQLFQQAKLEEAITVLQRGAASAPRDFAINWALAQRLSDACRHVQSEFYFRRVIQIDPLFTPARLALAESLHLQARYVEALGAADQVVADEPHNAAAHRSRASNLLELRRFSDAIAAIDRAELFQPGDRTTQLRTSLASHLGLCDQWIAPRIHGGSITVSDPYCLAAWGFMACACSTISAERLADFHRVIGHEIESWARPAALPLHNTADPDRRLRIGMISPDLRSHSVAFFLEPLLRSLDRQSSSVYLYLNHAEPDAVTHRLATYAHTLRVIPGMSETALAQRLRDDQIDVLIDLAGHTFGSAALMFRSRLAPVQINYLGYPHSTGLSCFEARFVDSITDPPGSEHLATEPLVRLDPCFLCYQPPEAPPPHQPRSPTAGSPITFGSFNSLWKLSDAAMDLAAGTLAAVPDSRLVLKTGSLSDPWVGEQVRGRFAARGIAPERIVPLAPTKSTLDHLALYGQVDIALDPTPYNGTTTTCEALHMGVPVIALRGDRHCARVSASILSAIGHPELIAESPDGYPAIAAALAADASRLAKLHGSLRADLAGSILCDGPAFARRFENAVRSLWRDWCRKQPASA